MIVRSPFFGIVQLATSALGGATLAQATTDTERRACRVRAA